MIFAIKPFQFAALALWALALPALAAGAEEAAQEILRQQERERALRKELEYRPDVRLPAGGARAERIPEAEKPCFPIRELRLSDPSGEFAWAIAAADLPDDPATGRCLGSQGIGQVMSRIQNAIIERGYVTTRVLAKAQDLTSGLLEITIFPGRIRAIRFTGDASRASLWNAFPASPGDLLNLRDIEQALENWRRLPTVEADIRIEPGEASGESDLVIAWKQAFPLRITLSANDGGSKATGKNQGSASISGDNLFSLNDLFYITWNHDLADRNTRGTRGRSLHYSLPFGYWTLGATHGDHRYHQTVAGAFQNYVYSGQSETEEIKLSRLVYRDAANKSTLFLRGYLTRSQNFIDRTEIEVQRRRMAGWEAGVGHRAFLGGATLDLDLSYRRGTGAFSALRAPEDAFGEGTARPRIVSAEASLSLPFRLFGQNLRYQGLWRAQWNRSPLVPQDRFSIGGRYTVRGFDGESVLMAERGYLLRNDLSLALAEGHEIYIGLDHGRVGGVSAKLLVGRELSGVLIGLRGAWRHLSYDLFAGRPVNHPKYFNSEPVTTGFNLSLSY